MAKSPATFLWFLKSVKTCFLPPRTSFLGSLATLSPELSGNSCHVASCPRFSQGGPAKLLLSKHTSPTASPNSMKYFGGNLSDSESIYQLKHDPVEHLVGSKTISGRKKKKKESLVPLESSLRHCSYFSVRNMGLISFLPPPDPLMIRSFP